MPSATRKINPRAVAAQVIEQVLVKSRYLDTALTEAQARLPREQAREAALIQEMAYGTLRWFHQLDAIARQFLAKPLKPKDQDVHALLLLGLYQLRHMRTATHAAVTETVEAAEALKKPWAKNLLNACLRAYLREPEQADAAVAGDVSVKYSYPVWLVREIRQHYPENWEAILGASNERPPMALRVNLQKNTRAQYRARLSAAGLAAQPADIADSAVVLETPVPVTDLPGFAQGEVSVQDVAAQMAAILLEAKAGERVLDACAAPGGKTGHILERTPGLAELVALDQNPERVALIAQNLARLGLSAQTLTADAGVPADWWDGRVFDRILLDAPCSATGVIRRHPDIKVRRKPDDLQKLVETQARLLDRLWPLLKPGGKLLYVTCSILPAENENQMQAFVAHHTDAAASLLPLSAGLPRAIGRQILPGEQGMDGFYYACIDKN